MGWRCELCDDFLPLLQFSHLCPTCYKIRTIIKCYNSKQILDCLERRFIVDYELKKALTLPPEEKTLNPIPEEDEGEGTDDSIDKQHEEFKAELEKKVEARFKERNIKTRSQNKKSN